jgi:hypothetical protein
MHPAGTLSRPQLDRINGIRQLINDGVYQTTLRLAQAIGGPRVDVVRKDFVPLLRMAMHEASASGEQD